MKVVSYYRYSSDNKRQRDNSEARQQENVERVIALQGWNHVASFTDKAVSGLDDKPELLKIKDMVENGNLKVDIIAVDDLSRLTRRRGLKQYLDLEWIEDCGIKVSIAVYNNGEPMTIEEMDDDLGLTVVKTSNNQYVKKLSDVITRGLRKKWDRGALGWIGKAPYGYDLERTLDEPSTLKPNSDLPIIKEIFTAVLGGASVRGCIHILEKCKRFQENPEKHANTTSVKNILRNSIYCGIRTYGVRSVGKMNGVAEHKTKYIKQNPLRQAYGYQEYKAEGFESIITVDEYQKIQKILDYNQAKHKKYPDRQKHRYSGIVRCADCFTPMTASSFKRRSSGERMVAYVCPKSTDGSRTCKTENGPNRKAVRTEELDHLVLWGVNKYVMADGEGHMGKVQQIIDLLVERSKNPIQILKDDYELQQKRLEDLQEFYMETGNKSLMPKMRKLATELDELAESISVQEEEEASADMVDFARTQYESSRNKGEAERYFGGLYGIAVEAMKKKGRARERFLKAEAKAWKEKAGSWYGLEEGKVTDPEEALAILRDMNLNYIDLFWSVEEYRGQPRQTAEIAGFDFSMGDTTDWATEIAAGNVEVIVDGKIVAAANSKLKDLPRLQA